MPVIIAHRSPGAPGDEPPSEREQPPARPAFRCHGLRPGRLLFVAAALLLCRGVAAAADGPPIIISEPTSTRAVALTTPTFQPQPFPLTCAAAICQGQRTRVMLFVMGLAPRPGEAAPDVTARAEDGDRRFYDLAVEHVAPISGYGWMSAVVLKLGDEVGDVGDVLLSIKYRGADSNRVRIGLGHLGGGPPDDAGALPSPAPPFSLGGFVRDGVAGLGGVSVAIGGAGVAPLLTLADGSFALGNLSAGGAYTLTPSKPCYSFTPAAFVVESLYRNTSVNFAGAENRIDGRVLDAGGRPLAAVSIALGGAQTGASQTGADGAFAFACLAPGDYTVTPTHALYNFAPASLSLAALAGPRAADFNATLKQFTARGRITNPDGTALAGVAITLSGTQAGATTTDASGDYALAGLQAGGSYTLTPSLAHHTFAPPSRSFANLSGDATANFVGVLNTHVISGRVVDTADNGLANVTVTLSGAQTATTQTDAGGNYNFPALPAGAAYTVTPALANYTFAPPSRTFSNLAADQRADFTNALNAHAISGRVADAGNNPLAGVSVALTGSQSAAAQTDAGGNYAFANLPAGGNYIVTPSLANYTFAPPGRSFNGLASNQTADFAATLNTFQIAGRVSGDANAPLSGVTVTLSGSRSAITTTDAAGNYSFAALPAGNSYTVTLSKAHYTFAPASRAFNNLSAHQTGDFTAARNTHAIAGRIAQGANNYLQGVTVTLSGARTATTQTNAAGSYSFTNLGGGGDYTVTASLKHHTFAPQTRAFNNLSSDGTADFAATFNSHAIRGRVFDEGGAGVAGVAVALGGTRDAAATTDAGGNYSFAALPAGGNYTIAASKPQYDLAPASRTYEDLASDQRADFAATLVRYTISGRVVTPAGSGLGGATVSLSGAQETRTTQTAPDGRYAFAAVAALGDYTVNAARINYDLGPANQVFADLDADRTANFTGVLRRYSIRGRFTSGGRPLAAVHVALNGSQTSSAIADAAGNFSFDVPAEGDYTVTPSPQHFYAYSPPAQSFAVLSADTSADFSATPVAPPATQHVLDWDGSAKTVDYSYFFNTPGDLGHFFWEFWAMPGANAGATYLLSDGYGGAHAVLFGFGGFNTTDPNHYQLIGNVWNGGRIVSFNSDEGPGVGEWGHLAVGWDGAEIVSYFNGVPVGRTAFAGPRREGGFGNGAGRLLVGGSDHNNLVGRIAQVRGFENGNPRVASSGGNASGVRAAFAPDTVFRTGGQVLSNYFEPRQLVPDISAGLAGVLHHGQLRGTPHPYGLLEFCETCPRPQYVIDPTAPDFATATDRSRRAFNPPAAPDGALVYDSFSRRNSTYVLGGAGGLGETESGAAGRLTWQSAPSTPTAAAFGILNERAVVLANRRALAWVALPPASLSTGHELRVRRRTGTRAVGHDTGLVFRVADADNYFFAYTTGGNSAPNARALTVGYYLNGQRTELASGISIAGGWAELRVVTTPAGAIRVYANDAPVYSTTHGLLAGANGAGLYSNAPGLSLSNRWDDFIVYELPAP